MNQRLSLFLIIATVFTLGLLSASLLPQVTGQQTTPELPSPSDTITEDMIHVYKNGVYVKAQEGDDQWLIKMDLADPTWSTFTDTNSMDPVIDVGSNTIRMHVPCNTIQEGDIITYEHATYGKIIHRVIHKDTDEQGPYFVLKGDNNPTSDPGKVRCEQILGKVVAIFY